MNGTKPLVSIILPVYNGERFIASAIASVMSQTYTNWELLIVNDGSDDESASIIEGFSTKDNRIRSFHQPNGGVNSARAKGVDNAGGEYLTFLDADDTLIPAALQVMTDALSETVDLVCCGKESLSLDRDDYLKALWRGSILPGICTKMFKAALYKQIDYALDRHLVMGEDLLINSIYALTINRAVIIPTNVYCVNYQNEASVTKTFKHNWEYEKFYFSKVQELFLDKCTDLDSYEQTKLLVYKSWLNAMKYVMLDGGRIDYKDARFKEVKDFFDTHKGQLGPSEKLIFSLQNASLYRLTIKTYQKILKNRKGL